jgi:hypothetical protein
VTSFGSNSATFVIVDLGEEPKVDTNAGEFDLGPAEDPGADDDIFLGGT